MTGRNPWPPKGTRPIRPEDNDPDSPIYVRVPDHIRDAYEQQRKTQQISCYRRLANWIATKLGRP
jgi:arylamine N-acetyltransferase